MGKKVIYFLLLLLVTTAINYFTPKFVGSIFFIIILIIYFRSKDEPFWLAYMLTISDGFLGFFGDYQAVLSVMPGLPPAEVGLIYIMLSVIKARKYNAPPRYFYNLHLQLIVVYLIFLVVQGYTVGLSLNLNIQFRLIKLLVPMLIFYSLPRLFIKEEDYRLCFAYLFPVALVAFFTQAFTIGTGMAPPTFLGADDPSVAFAFEVSEGKTYRGLFNPYILIITLFGALFYLAFKERTFSFLYLLSVITANMLCCFLSATRGWTVGFGLAIVLYLLLVFELSITRLLSLTIVATIIIMSIISIPTINIQVQNSIDRMMTMNAIAEGDLTAGGTLSRISERGPEVIKRWLESPLTGWGFSDLFFYYQDGHVGNQNILLHSGIIGMFLMGLFFAYFLIKLFFLSARLPSSHPYRKGLLVFVVIFLGWFFIHSSSFQCFSYYSRPNSGIVQAIFFCFGGLLYYKAVYQEDSENNAELPVLA